MRCCGRSRRKRWSFAADLSVSRDKRGAEHQISAKQVSDGRTHPVTWPRSRLPRRRAVTVAVDGNDRRSAASSRLISAGLAAAVCRSAMKRRISGVPMDTIRRRSPKNGSKCIVILPRTSRSDLRPFVLWSASRSSVASLSVNEPIAASGRTPASFALRRLRSSFSASSRLVLFVVSRRRADTESRPPARRLPQAPAG